MIDLQMKSTDSFDRWHTEQTTCTGFDEPNRERHERIKKDSPRFFAGGCPYSAAISRFRRYHREKIENAMIYTNADRINGGKSSFIRGLLARIPKHSRE